MNNKIKINLGGLVLGLIATSLYLVLPGGSPLHPVAYAATLVAILLMVLSARVLTQGSANLPQDSVFPLLAWSYLVGNLLLSLLVLGLDSAALWSAPWPLFCVAQTLLLGWFTLRILAASAGQEHITTIGEAVAIKIIDWRLILADLDAIKSRLPASVADRAQALKELQKVYEAFRYSDPMSNPVLAELEATLKADVSTFEATVAGGNNEAITLGTTALLNRLKDRNNRVQLLKQSGGEVQRLKSKENEGSILDRIPRQVRALLVLWLGVVLSVGTLATGVIVYREHEARRVVDESQLKARTDAKEQIRLAAVVEKERLSQLGLTKLNAEIEERAFYTKLGLIQPVKKGAVSTIGSVASVRIRSHWVSAGQFTMGSPDSEANRGSDEVQHAVVISRGFLMAETECTQAQWQAVMGNNPSQFKGENLPVEQVSWEDATAFCAKLTDLHRKEGLLPPKYRWNLPTEAQWEYACRAGTTGAYAGELEAMSWHDKDSASTSHEVKSKQPNEWGLYDMHGNVWEWCSDWAAGYTTEGATDPVGATASSARVIRGGSWSNEPRVCRSASRLKDEPHNRNAGLGFRIVLSSFQ
jgi:formylglycine-generating enzyme required for sulfatase activity